MLLKYLLFTYLIIMIVLGIINGLSTKISEKGISRYIAEISKIVLPIFAFIATFVDLDFYSLCFIAYLSAYYIIEAVYNLTSKIQLKDYKSIKYYPKWLEIKLKSYIAISTMAYAYFFHILCYYTVNGWLSFSTVGKFFAILFLVILFIFTIMGLSLFIYDIYSMISFPIINNSINKTINDINKITYKKLSNRINYILTFFKRVYESETLVVYKLKILQDNLKHKFDKSRLKNTLIEEDKSYIIELLVEFQASYMKS